MLSSVMGFVIHEENKTSGPGVTWQCNAIKRSVQLRSLPASACLPADFKASASDDQTGKSVCHLHIQACQTVRIGLQA